MENGVTWRYSSLSGVTHEQRDMCMTAKLHYWMFSRWTDLQTWEVVVLYFAFCFGQNSFDVIQSCIHLESNPATQEVFYLFIFYCTPPIAIMENVLQWPSYAKLFPRSAAVQARRFFSLSGNAITQQWVRFHPTLLLRLFSKKQNWNKKQKPWLSRSLWNLQASPFVSISFLYVLHQHCFCLFFSFTVLY